MNRAQLIAAIRSKKSCLCVGLDTDIKKIPSHLSNTEDPVFEFNKAIIDATLPYTVAYKVNTAFYEANGSKGWKSLERTVAYLPDSVFKIADAKRGDIGNTTDMYASAFFEHMNFDSVTIAPYMGADSILPFLKYTDKWAIILALTSNASSSDFQLKKLSGSNTELYREVLNLTSAMGTIDNTMFVVGATKASELKVIRELVPNHFLLIPGVGAQGGTVKDVFEGGANKDCGLLINSSRGIIYASPGEDFAEAAAKEARNLQQEMELLLK